MMPDDLVYDEAQELFAEFGIEFGLFGEAAEARDEKHNHTDTAAPTTPQLMPG